MLIIDSTLYYAMEIPTYDELFICYLLDKDNSVADSEIIEKWKLDIQTICANNIINPIYTINIGDCIKIPDIFRENLTNLIENNEHIVSEFIDLLLLFKQFKITNIKNNVVTIKNYRSVFGGKEEIVGNNIFIPINILSQVILIKSDYKITKAAIKGK
jgi:hypothetical protein